MFYLVYSRYDVKFNKFDIFVRFPLGSRADSMKLIEQRERQRERGRSRKNVTCSSRPSYTITKRSSDTLTLASSRMP